AVRAGQRSGRCAGRLASRRQRPRDTRPAWRLAVPPGPRQRHDGRPQLRPARARRRRADRPPGRRAGPVVRAGRRWWRIRGRLPARRRHDRQLGRPFRSDDRRYVADTGVPMLAVDYRLAPEHPHPTPVEDCYAGLTWLVEHAAELNVDPARIAVMGDSAGGGLAAGTTLLARDRGLPVARQILVYPMLDDRTTTDDPALAPFLGWSADDNYTGWHALLGDAAGGPEVSSYAAPARASDLSGLPPSYVEVGELDLFRDESVDYARRIAAAGASVELHVHPGCPHGFELIAPDSAVARRARADRLRVLKGF
ncbi:LOW QUALITY PROTEIN: alpha/beta hydrolase, partial [Kutzneria sp. 744]